MSASLGSAHQRKMLEIDRNVTPNRNANSANINKDSTQGRLAESRGSHSRNASSASIAAKSLQQL